VRIPALIGETAKCFYGCYSVLFWLKQNGFETVSISVMFEYCFNCADSSTLELTMLYTEEDRDFANANASDLTTRKRNGAWLRRFLI